MVNVLNAANKKRVKMNDNDIETFREIQALVFDSPEGRSVLKVRFSSLVAQKNSEA